LAQTISPLLLVFTPTNVSLCFRGGSLVPTGSLTTGPFSGASSSKRGYGGVVRTG
jgi:hypothetical protein